MEDHSSESLEASYGTHYCNVAEAMKLITHPFDGNKKKLREFIENVDITFELVHPSIHEILKFVKTKITGDARSKLIVRDLTHTWELVRGILGENYVIRRTLIMPANSSVLGRKKAKVSPHGEVG